MTERERARRRRQSQADLERLTYNVREAAVILGIGVNQAHEWVEAKKIPSLQHGRRIIIPGAALRRLASEGVCTPTTTAPPRSPTGSAN